MANGEPLGCRQVVRHGPLEPAFGGSNPPTPASGRNARLQPLFVLRESPAGLRPGQTLLEQWSSGVME